MFIPDNLLDKRSTHLCLLVHTPYDICLPLLKVNLNNLSHTWVIMYLMWELCY